MATFKVWYGERSFVHGDDYEVLEFEGKEIGAVSSGDNSVRYRFFETAGGTFVVHYVEHISQYEARADVYEYSDINEAAKYFHHVLRSAKLI